MKAEGEKEEKKAVVRAEPPASTPTAIHKSPTKKMREPLRSPKKQPPRSKDKLSSSDINASAHRKATEEK
jgi:hypothetical protein